MEATAEMKIMSAKRKQLRSEVADSSHESASTLCMQHLFFFFFHLKHMLYEGDELAQVEASLDTEYEPLVKYDLEYSGGGSASSPCVRSRYSTSPILIAKFSTDLRLLIYWTTTRLLSTSIPCPRLVLKRFIGLAESS